MREASQTRDLFARKKNAGESRGSPRTFVRAKNALSG
jgi:hypothetical protein